MKRRGCVCGSKKIRRHFPTLSYWERVKVLIDMNLWRVL